MTRVSMAHQTDEVADVGMTETQDPTASKSDTKADAPEAVQESVEMKDGASSAAATPKAPTRIRVRAPSGTKSTGSAVVATPASVSKPGKKLNRKGSRRSLGVLNLDAQPGEHFLVKLKGYPAWPAIICDEEMLPQALIESRPKSALRSDGSFDDNYADGGKRAADRNFAVMYLFTNEFGWVLNSSLQRLTADKAAEAIKDNMRRDLKAAFELAAQDNSLDHYKEMLVAYQDDLLAQENASSVDEPMPPKQKSKSKISEPVDSEMEDEPAEEVLSSKSKSKSKSRKRKAEEEVVVTPAQSNSTKKPKTKSTASTSTKQTANGKAGTKIPESDDSPKASKVSKTSKVTKATKSKSAKKGAKQEKKKDAEAAASQQPELSMEETLKRRKRELLWLRHKLQKGLIIREDQPKDEEMDELSELIGKLESHTDLEVSVIRETKINKVLKAILKLDAIPREDEFNFKPRSQALMEKWTKILASDAPETPVLPSVPSNGVHEDREASVGADEVANKSAKDEDEKDTAMAVDATE